MAQQYPVRITPDGDGYLVQFPDIPEAITFGESVDHAKEMAHNALLTALEFYFEDLREVPEPSAVEPGQDYVELSASIALKIQSLNLSVNH